MSKMLRLAALPAVLAVATASALAAQQMVEQPRIHALELTFHGGYFQPTGTSGAIGGVNLTRRPAWVGGVRFDAYAPGGRWGVEVAGSYSPERVLQSSGSGNLGSRRTNALIGTAKFLLGRSPRKSGISYMISGGLGALHRKKSVLDSNVKSTDITGVAGLMIRIPIDGQVGLRLDGDDLIYSADYGTGKKMRNDFVLTAGLGISW
jgi:opacity protein-like surface antigen